jgi:hypothetical protein
MRGKVPELTSLKRFSEEIINRYVKCEEGIEGNCGVLQGTYPEFNL